MNRLLRSPSLITTLVVVLMTATVSMHVLWGSDGGEGWRNTIRSDAKGYYGYLVALFIRHDLGQEPTAWEYVQETPHGTLNKYFSGTAVMMAPWFFLGQALTALDGSAPSDGHGEYHMKALAIGGWTYLLLGLLALRALLSGMGVRDAVIAWTTLGLGLGTVLLQYSAVQPGWSHVYSFCAVSVFLLLVHRLERGAPLSWAIAAAALLGLIILIRPVNGLVLLATPIVAGSGTPALLHKLWHGRRVLFLAILAGALVVAVQPLLWYLQTGRWIEWGYRNEGFHWDRPEVLEVLFGFRRGLFLWTPLLLLPALCALLLWRTDRVRSGFSVAYWAINTYVIASWWIWYYGSGFGSRVYIDHLPVLAIPMALVLNNAPRRWWTAARAYIALCTALFLAQFVQYHRGILHHEHMDRDKYKATFLRFGQQHRDRLGGKWEAPPFNPRGMEAVMVAATDLERPSDRWKDGHVVRHPKAFSGEHVCVFDEAHEFGTMFHAPAGSLPTERGLYLEAGLQCYEERAGDSFDALVVVAVQRPDSSFSFYTSFRMNPIPGASDSTWRYLEYRVPVPALEQGDRLLFHLWGRPGRSRFLTDDLFMRVWAVNPY